MTTMRALRCIFPKTSFPYRTTKLQFQRLFSTPFSSLALPDARDAELSSLLRICGREGNFRLGSSIHASVIKSPPFYLPQTHAAGIYNSILHLYCKCGVISDAVKLFDEMHLRDTVSWNTLISGLLKLGEIRRGLGYFKSLLGSDVHEFDQASLTSVLSACDRIELVRVVNVVHGVAILRGYDKDMAVGNALITAYFKCRSFSSGMCVFDDMVDRNVVTWTAVISGLAQNDFYGESLKLFVEMYYSSVSPNIMTYLSTLSACSGLQSLKDGAQIHCIVWKLGIQNDLRIESALMDLYSKCSLVEDAWRIFESAEVLDEVSVTVILVGLTQNGFEEEAINMFVKMVRTGAEIDPSMISSVLGVFGIGTSQGLGPQVHSLVIKQGYDSNIFINNGLINMYSKNGELGESLKVFDSMIQRNQVSWNSMIAAFARHGNGLRALKLFDKMMLNGVEPSDVTFLSLLHACSHVGLLHKGMEYLNIMQKVYGMGPRAEHYACIVDMLGRAGLLTEARDFIEGLPVKPGVLVWQALLGACSIHNNIDMGKYAADRLADLDPDSPVSYVSLANIYSSRGRWKARARTLKEMREKGVAKVAGTSWIEIEKRVHSFVVADQMHPQGEEVYGLLLEMFDHMRDEEDAADSLFSSL